MQTLSRLPYADDLKMLTHAALPASHMESWPVRRLMQMQMLCQAEHCDTHPC